VAEASDPMEQAKHGGDHSSRPAVLQARQNEQKALSLWLKGATYQQIAVTGFGINSREFRSKRPIRRDKHNWLGFKNSDSYSGTRWAPTR